MVIIPLEVSYSSALREMSTDFFGSPVEMRRPHAAKRAGEVRGAEVVAKNSFVALSRYSMSSSEGGGTWSSEASGS